MSNLSKIFAGLLFFSFACVFVHAGSIEFQEVLSFSVPGLGDIEKVDFGDVDLDGHMDVLASDRDSVILYSHMKDQVLFRYSIDTTRNSQDTIFYGILLDDINRDYLLDIAIGVCSDPYVYPGWFRVYFQNGTSFFGPIDSVTVEYQTHPATLFTFSPGLGVFDAVDFDADGNKEFVFSCDSSFEDFQYLWDRGAIKGITRIYHAFPDSILYQDDYFYTDAQSLPEPHDNSVVLHRHTESYDHMWGSGVYTRRRSDSYIIVTDLDGFTANSELPNPLNHESNSSPSYCNNSSDYSCSVVKCMGNIDQNHIGLEAVIYNGETNCCHDGPEWECTSVKALKLHSIDNPDSLSEIRELALTEGANGYIYLPDHPGFYCAFVGDRFVQFNGDDGTEFQSTSLVPDGIKKWDYPFDDGQPYLVVLNADTVSIYQPVIVTDADDDDDIPLPTVLSLGKPYPNPFNAAQTIPITARPGKRVTVDVYNLLGQHVDRIYCGVAHSLRFDISWEADKLASGIYLIRAVSGDESAVVKSILLK